MYLFAWVTSCRWRARVTRVLGVCGVIAKKSQCICSLGWHHGSDVPVWLGSWVLGEELEMRPEPASSLALGRQGAVCFRRH